MSRPHSTRLAAVRLIAALALALTMWPALARPVAAATYTVTTAVDENDGSCSDGDCSLRDAIILANNNPGADTISFNIPGCGGVCTIQPTSALPALSGGSTTINGYSQPGAAQATGSSQAILLIQIHGNYSDFNGLEITSANNVIQGLAINNFNRHGIYIYGSGATGNTISGNYVGTNASGAAGMGNDEYGVCIEISADNNVIGGSTPAARNLISANFLGGVLIYDSGTTGNVVSGNYIGTDASGTAALANHGGGVRISNGAQSNTVGGDTPGKRNLISGNSVYAVSLSGSSTMSNTVSGNYIGLDYNGAASLGNEDGIEISGGARNNTIGGDAAGERNVISSNEGDGVEITGSGTTGNVVSGNYIGTNAAGTAASANVLNGVRIGGGAQSNTVGGDVDGERNVISGNGFSGVYITDSNTMSNTVSGNYIGVNAAGTAALPNVMDGVRIGSGARNNTIGGDVTGERNVISGNDGRGVSIAGSGTAGNTVSGNIIGANAAGTSALGNAGVGVRIDFGAQSNTVGGDVAGERNVISGNDGDGVHITGSGTMSNTVSGNYIGTTLNGTASLANNGEEGVRIDGGAQNNAIGGTTGAKGNLVSGNGGNGVTIAGSGTAGNTVSGNIIGANAAGAGSLANGLHGIFIGNSAQGNTIGGDVASERNLISGNTGDGVYISGSGTTGNVVSGNTIGADAAGTAALGNGTGIAIWSGAQSNTIGGDATGEGNLISGNKYWGILISGDGTANNTISGNTIGADAGGTADLGNGDDGVYIASGAQNTAVGGDVSGERNVISGNGGDGVYISDSGTTGTVVSGNYIGTNAAGTASLGNDENGIFVSGAPGTTIGGDTAGERNVISGNGQRGVSIGGGAAGAVVSGNYIGTNATGTASLGNDANGVVVEGAPGATIGGDTAGERNVISGNGFSGVLIVGSATGAVVSGNTIGTNAAGTAALPNATGVSIASGAQSNTIGGDAAAEGNLISGNSGDGIYIAGSSTMSNTVSGNAIGVNAAGTAALGNGTGVAIESGAQSNTIGGDATAEGNLISGNSFSGVAISGSGTMSNTVSGNTIGANAAGTAALGNGTGVSLSGGAQGNTIGGGAAGERNLISGNDGNGVAISGSGTMSNTVSGNAIGTNAAGTAGLGNMRNGVFISGGAQSNTVGGDAAGERNIISANGLNGVAISGSGTAGNVVSTNYIGTDFTGRYDLGNVQYGASIGSGAQDNTIGGDAAGERNVISGNDGGGVAISGSGTAGNTVAGNTIGASSSGTIALGNGGRGVYFSGDAQDNTVGPGNLIAHNTGNGVEVSGSGTIRNIITQNSIFSNDMGIDLVSGANGGIAAPVIATTVGASSVAGTACPNCTVEVFENNNTDGEGKIYVASTTATAAGDFTANLGSLGAPYLTATATDAISGTSEFSAVFSVAPANSRVYLPLIVR